MQVLLLQLVSFVDYNGSTHNFCLYSGAWNRHNCLFHLFIFISTLELRQEPL